MKKLFDEKNGLLLLDELVLEMDSYQKIIADRIITDDEIMAQSVVVVELFKQIDTTLKDQDKALVLKTIAELAVLYQLNSIR